MRTARLILRPSAPGDADMLVPLIGDIGPARVSARVRFPCGRDQLASFLAGQETGRQAGRTVTLVLERAIDGVAIGWIGADLDDAGDPDLNFWVARTQWGRGYATEAARRLIRYLFEVDGAPRVVARTEPDNAAARRVLAAAGLGAGDDRRHDPAAVCFVRTREDWAAAHAARPKVLVAAAALVDGDGRVLMTTRPPGKAMAGLWEFPGGKVADGETPEQALVRELDEELGIDVTESCLAPVAFASYDYDTFHLLMPLYVVRVWRGMPAPREGQALRWVRAARLGDLPMPPADIPLVAMLREWV